MSSPTFTSLPFSSSQTVSWIHIGDTHMTRTGEQNEIDLGKIVDEINALYAKGGVDFVFVPGDIADDGGVVAYEAFRKHLDRLRLPWCAIVGDHDVHEESYNNFKKYIASDLYSAFTIGPYRFLRLNAFSTPRPDSMIVDDDQLTWLENELEDCNSEKQRAVLFLHCYPSDLKKGGSALVKLIRRHNVLLMDMGHTHYNEISNDGHTLYTATRSTGQIEEGPVGYSMTTLDGEAVSWQFSPLGTPSLVVITKPSDERLLTDHSAVLRGGEPIEVHAKAWSSAGVTKVHAIVEGKRVELASEDGYLWTTVPKSFDLRDGVYKVMVTASDKSGKEFESSIRLLIGARPEREYAVFDHENSIGAWPERGLLDTKLGPNKNGKKW